MADKPLTFEALIGELRELATRVVAFDFRDMEGAIVLPGEGEFGGLCRMLPWLARLSALLCGCRERTYHPV